MLETLTSSLSSYVYAYSCTICKYHIPGALDNVTVQVTRTLYYRLDQLQLQPFLEVLCLYHAVVIQERKRAWSLFEMIYVSYANNESICQLE